MSLGPSNDLVLEVSRAADPNRAAAVIEKLNALSSAGAASPEAFTAALNSAGGANRAASVAGAQVPLRGPSVARPERPEAKLESVVLTELIGQMLPKDTPSAYGQGFAGDMWRSMLAERVADQMAASGRLGIASKLFAGHNQANSGSVLAAAHKTEANAAQASGNALSTASGAEIKNGGFLFARSHPL